MPKLNTELRELVCNYTKITVFPELNENLDTLYSGCVKLHKLFHNDGVITDAKKQFINGVYKCRYRLMCLKYKAQFRRWLWERVRRPLIELRYHPDQLLERLNGMRNADDDDELTTVVESWE